MKLKAEIYLKANRGRPSVTLICIIPWKYDKLIFSSFLFKTKKITKINIISSIKKRHTVLLNQSYKNNLITSDLITKLEEIELELEMSDEELKRYML